MMRCETTWQVFDHKKDRVVFTGQHVEDAERWVDVRNNLGGDDLGEYEVLEARTWKAPAVITYDLDRSWEVWAVDVVVPQHIVDMDEDESQDEALRLYIESGVADIEHMSMKDSGNSGMTIDEVELT